MGGRGAQRMVQAGLAAGALALYLDERGLARPWRWVRHAVRESARERGAGQRTMGDMVDLWVRSKARPPPIGCTEWPAGRVLLEWAVGEVPPAGARVLEIGAGVGVTSLGLARTLARCAGGSAGPATAIVATDVCEASLDNLRENARANGIEVLTATDCQAPPRPGCIRVAAWDAAGGDESVRSLRTDLGIDPRTLTHVIGGDVIYHGFGDRSANGGLVRTLAALLRENPDIKVTLLLVDRFSGGAVAAVSQVAGVNQTSLMTAQQIDPAIAGFEEQCEREGLVCDSCWVPEPLRAQGWPYSLSHFLGHIKLRAGRESEGRKDCAAR